MKSIKKISKRGIFITTATVCLIGVATVFILLNTFGNGHTPPENANPGNAEVISPVPDKLKEILKPEIYALLGQSRAEIRAECRTETSEQDTNYWYSGLGILPDGTEGNMYISYTIDSMDYTGVCDYISEEIERISQFAKATTFAQFEQALEIMPISVSELETVYQIGDYAVFAEPLAENPDVIERLSVKDQPASGENAPSLEEDDPEALSAADLLAPIINAYAALEESGFQTYDEALIGDSLLASSKGSSYNFGWDNKPMLMYAFYDINTEGVSEMLIGGVLGPETLISGMYALQSGNPASVIQADDRHNLYLRTSQDGSCIVEHLWGHMEYATNFFYALDENGQLVTLDKLYTNGDDTAGSKVRGHFRAKEIDGEQVSITEEDYLSLVLKYGSSGYEPLEATGEEKRISLLWKPVSDAHEDTQLSGAPTTIS